MRLLLLSLSLASVCAIKSAAAELDTALPSRESIEWCDIWISHANETKLPRVLLIGDSIARDYYPEVERRLSGKAFVARLATSRFIADPVLLKEIELVVDQAKFDVIHFNNGMHGWQRSEAEYQQAFPKFLEAIRSHAPQARLIWAASTPLRDGWLGENLSVKEGQEAARIASLNALSAAKQYMGGLDRLKKLVKLAVQVATTEKFTEHASVADGASNLFVQIFGPESGHVRLVYGVQSLPIGAPVVVEVIFEIEPGESHPSIREKDDPNHDML